MFSDHKHPGCKDIMVFVWHLILQDHVMKVLNDFRSFNEHSRFYHRYCGGKDITALVCPMNSQDHMIKWYYDILGRSQLRWVTILPCLVFMGTPLVDEMLFVCHANLQDLKTKALCNFSVRSTQKLVTILVRLVAIGISVVVNI